MPGGILVDHAMRNAPGGVRADFEAPNGGPETITYEVLTSIGRRVARSYLP